MLYIKPNRGSYFSPLRYPGGKAALYPFLSKMMVENRLVDNTYVEPYAGGAGAALALLMMEKVSDIVINDLDFSIYCFWKSILNNTDKFIKKIESTDISIKEWERQQRIKESTASELSLGFATFYLNRTNYSGVINARPIGGFEQKGQWKIDARFVKKSLIERIRKIAYFKDRISVTNDDGLKVIKKYRGDKDAFIYLDPPYYVKGGSLYLNAYEHNNHAELAKLLESNAKAHWLLTYDNVEEIRNLYSKREVVPFEICYSANKKGKGQEVMIFPKSTKFPELN